MRAKLTIPGMPFGVTVPRDIELQSLEQHIIDFLDGRSDGAELMLAIYGDFAEEKLPPRLAALLQRWRAS